MSYCLFLFVTNKSKLEKVQLNLEKGTASSFYYYFNV
jgi:hypothetical protein